MWLSSPTKTMQDAALKYVAATMQDDATFVQRRYGELWSAVEGAVCPQAAAPPTAPVWLYVYCVASTLVSLVFVSPLVCARIAPLLSMQKQWSSLSLLWKRLSALAHAVSAAAAAAATSFVLSYTASLASATPEGCHTASERARSPLVRPPSPPTRPPSPAPTPLPSVAKAPAPLLPPPIVKAPSLLKPPPIINAPQPPVPPLMASMAPVEPQPPPNLVRNPSPPQAATLASPRLVPLQPIEQSPSPRTFKASLPSSPRAFGASLPPIEPPPSPRAFILARRSSFAESPADSPTSSNGPSRSSSPTPTKEAVALSPCDVAEGHACQQLALRATSQDAAVHTPRTLAFKRPGEHGTGHVCIWEDAHTQQSTRLRAPFSSTAMPADIRTDVRPAAPDPSRAFSLVLNDISMSAASNLRKRRPAPAKPGSHSSTPPKGRAPPKEAAVSHTLGGGGLAQSSNVAAMLAREASTRNSDTQMPSVSRRIIVTHEHSRLQSSSQRESVGGVDSGSGEESSSDEWGLSI